MILFAVLAAGAYVAGSVNFSILLFKVLGKDDPRQSHSQNPGATNVYRQAGPLPAAAVLILDVGRAFVIGFAAVSWLDPKFVPWLGLALLLGNRYPCFHEFKGGKGVANYVGFTLAVSPLGVLISGLAWAGAFYFSRTPFLASFAMVAVLAVGNVACLGIQPSVAAGVAATVALIVCNHRKNMLERWGGRT